MEIKVSARRPGEVRSDLTVFLVHSDERWCELPDPSVARVIAEYRKAVGRKAVRDPLIWGSPATGKDGQNRYYMAAPERIDHLTVGEQIKTAAARAARHAASMRFKSMTVALNTSAGANWAPTVAEGLWLGSYCFDRYKTTKPPSPDSLKTELLVPKDELAQARAAVERTRIICESVNHARDLANEPGSALSPDALAGAAQSIGKQFRLQTAVFNEKQLRSKGYNGLLAVGRASHNPPRLIVVAYRPRRASATHLALLGKGITFDTGGICLKPAENMWQMKGDMSGAAAVLCAMRAIAQLRPAIRVTGIIAAAHNAIGPDAVLPGDVVRARSGKTIEVENTDAEGRIVLTDALYRAGEEGATHAIDVATLTGACHRALGHALAGLFCDDVELRNRILAAGERVGEGFWPLPLLDEYRDLIKSRIADVNNISSSKYGGAITAALFLREFVPAGVRWAHLDIAGTAVVDKEYKYFQKGATGAATRTLIELCMEEW
jgi:leucyl aminopeptidase